MSATYLHRSEPSPQKTVVKIDDHNGQIIVEECGGKFIVWLELPDFQSHTWERCEPADTLAQAMAIVAEIILMNVRDGLYQD